MLRKFVFFLAATSALWAQSPSLFTQVDEMLRGLSQITGWKVQRKVPAEMLSKEKFRKLIDQNLKDAAKDKEIRAQEITLKMFGLVPPDFKLLEESADLVTEQAAAFYDLKKKQLFVLDSTTSDSEQKIALVHELAHALADQHHSLDQYMHKGSPDDDAQTARQAVTEGQAMWLTWAYMAMKSGKKAELPQEMLDQLAGQVGAEGTDFPVFSQAPLYIRESLTFPYTAGLRFQDAVYRERGRASFDEVFARPPLSTQQILHAKTYLANLKPTEPVVPKLDEVAGKDAGREFKALIEGALGEFDVSALLRQYVGQAQGEEAASHWRGGSFRLYEHKRDKHPVLTYVAEWDSPAAARSYFFLYQQVMRKKWKSMEVANRSDTEVRGSGDSGKFVLRLEGSTVQSFEGLR